MSIEDKIKAFLDGSPHAVFGATPDRSKFGNKVLRAYLQNGRTAIPVNHFGEDTEGLTGYKDLASIPEKPYGISIITPPHVTEKIVEQAKALKIMHIWMQPGSESPIAIEKAEWAGINVIQGGPCILTTLGFDEHAGASSEASAPTEQEPEATPEPAAEAAPEVQAEPESAPEPEPTPTPDPTPEAAPEPESSAPPASEAPDSPDTADVAEGEGEPKSDAV
ncbi:MAG: CoA-binding protein [Planctomycetota bacterium]|nr:CoA-binding protein [Planctomycetota bacterium]